MYACKQRVAFTASILIKTITQNFLGISCIDSFSRNRTNSDENKRKFPYAFIQNLSHTGSQESRSGYLNDMKMIVLTYRIGLTRARNVETVDMNFFTPGSKVWLLSNSYTGNATFTGQLSCQFLCGM